MRKGRRHNLAKPLPVISGRVILLQDFKIVPGQGAGFTFIEIDAADLPDEAMYFGKDKNTGQILFQMPLARENHSRWRLTASIDSSWDVDKSYRWREQTNRAKEERGQPCPEPTTSTSY